jgi:pilus assembly protein CpaB
MNNRALFLSLAMAGLAVWMVQSYVSSIEDATQKKFGTEILVVEAKRDIKEGEDINETMLELKAIPKKFLEPGAKSFSRSDTQAREGENESNSDREMKNFAASGYVAVVPIKKGEQVTYNKIVEPGMRTGLAPQIAPGKRAIAIPVGEVSSVSKLVKPGDRVDLIAVLDMGGGRENRIAKTVLQDVVVLAVGRNVTGNVARVIDTDAFGGKEHIRTLSEDANFSSVTLEVEPSQAQALALVLNNADNVMTLSLRNNDDTDRQPVGSTSITDLLGADASKLRLPAGKR